MQDLSLKIQEVSSENEWNAFVKKTTRDTFHQAWEWGQIYVGLNSKVWYLGLYNNGVLVGACLAIYIKAKRGSFILVPHGPLLNDDIVQSAPALMQAIEEYTKALVVVAKRLGCVCVRVAPSIAQLPHVLDVFQKCGYRNAPIFVQSELSWRLKINEPEDVLFSKMRKSTRHILKKSPLDHISFVCLEDIEGFPRFYSLYKNTVGSQGFVGQGERFIKREFVEFAKSHSACFYFAQYKGRDVAAALIITFGKTGYYHYGASTKNEGGVPVPHLLQWHIINDLKKKGYEYYNFWGISPDDKPNHPWRGLTIFKKGFGGEELAYVKTQDFVLSWRYWPSWFLETLRRIHRRY